MKYIKEALKKILPLPVRTFLREMGELRQLIEGRADELCWQSGRQTAELAQLIETQAKLAEALRRDNAVLMQQMGTGKREILDELEKLEREQQEMLSKLGLAETERKSLLNAVERVQKQSAEGIRCASEAVWAATFNNTITDSAWLLNKTFSPGRWAVGYPVLYVMYRVLNEARPKRILELGLGQSTRMIGQYAAAFPDVEHIVVEHDPEWIAFFKNDFVLSERTEILRLDREMVPYKEAEAVRVFKGLQEALAEKKFDFIFIDAPLGGDMPQYARIDVIGLLPECLSDDFVIMMDDAQRGGETHTVAEMEKRLWENGISCKKGRYSGKKDCIVLTPEHRGFLTTM